MLSCLVAHAQFFLLNSRCFLTVSKLSSGGPHGLSQICEIRFFFRPQEKLSEYVKDDENQDQK